MPSRGTLWTDADTLIARELLGRSARDFEFRERLGRTRDSAASRIRWLDNPKVRYRDREADRLRAAAGRKAPIERTGVSERRSVPDDVLADAMRRNAADRTISQHLLGDPPPGQSALDRILRREEA